MFVSYINTSDETDRKKCIYSYTDSNIPYYIDNNMWIFRRIFKNNFYLLFFNKQTFTFFELTRNPQISSTTINAYNFYYIYHKYLSIV